MTAQPNTWASVESLAALEREFKEGGTCGYLKERIRQVKGSEIACAMELALLGENDRAFQFLDEAIEDQQANAQTAWCSSWQTDPDPDRQAVFLLDQYLGR